MAQECIDIGQNELEKNHSFSPEKPASPPQTVPVTTEAIESFGFRTGSPSSKGASPTSVFDMDGMDGQETKKGKPLSKPLSKQRRESVTRMDLFVEHVLSCVEETLKLTIRETEGACEAHFSWDVDGEEDFVDICAIRGTLRLVLFAPFSNLVTQRDTVSRSDAVWSEWANLTKEEVAECTLDSRALHRFALKALDSLSEGSSPAATVLTAAYHHLPRSRPSIWSALEAAVQTFLCRERALVLVDPSMLSQTVDVGSNQARQIGSLTALVRLWSRISKLALEDTNEGAIGGIAASIRLFQLFCRSRVQLERNEVTKSLEQGLAGLMVAAPIAPLAAVLPLLTKATHKGPSHCVVRLLKLVKVCLIGCPANILQGHAYLLVNVREQLLKLLGSSQFQVVLEALDIVGNTFILLHTFLSHPHGYAMLSEALCANRSHWHEAVRNQSEQCYDAILDYN